MQPRVLLTAVFVAGLIGAPAALAQTAPKKRTLPPPRPAADLTVPAPEPYAPAQASSAPLRLGGLVGMSPVGDAAPACRAQCSKDRYVCQAAGDPTDCDGRWVPCLQACSAR